MHDPMTVAFEIGRLITIWHVDPETDGTDDSCDWFGTRKTRENGWYPAVLDEYKSMPEGDQSVVDFIWYQWRSKLGRPWWKHPRWHIHHWKIQVHPLQDLQRWLFSRCAYCGKRFPWGYAPVGLHWHGPGPRWFKNEPDVYHHGCLYTKTDGRIGRFDAESEEKENQDA